MDRIVVIDAERFEGVLRDITDLGFEESLTLTRQEGVDEGTSRKTVLVWGYMPRPAEARIRAVAGVVSLLTAGGGMIVS